jgi:hypothetical protein
MPLDCAMDLRLLPSLSLPLNSILAGFCFGAAQIIDPPIDRSIDADETEAERKKWLQVTGTGYGVSKGRMPWGVQERMPWGVQGDSKTAAGHPPSAGGHPWHTYYFSH